MKKIKFSESQILNILKEKEQAYTVAELCRKHGITELTTRILVLSRISA